MSHMWECEFLAAREAEQSEADARSYVAEVAHGITHYAGCDALTPCTRCERDAALAEVEAAKQAIAIREDSIQTLGEKFVEVAEERDALRKRVGELEAATKQGPFGSEAQPKVADRCPACGHTSLFIGSGGWLTCGWLGCREPGVGRAFESRVEQARREGADETLASVIDWLFRDNVLRDGMPGAMPETREGVEDAVRMFVHIGPPKAKAGARTVDKLMEFIGHHSEECLALAPEKPCVCGVKSRLNPSPLGHRYNQWVGGVRDSCTECGWTRADHEPEDR